MSTILKEKLEKLTFEGQEAASIIQSDGFMVWRVFKVPNLFENKPSKFAATDDWMDFVKREETLNKVREYFDGLCKVRISEEHRCSFCVIAEPYDEGEQPAMRKVKIRRKRMIVGGQDPVGRTASEVTNKEEIISIAKMYVHRTVTFREIEERCNLRRMNGCTAYRLYQKARKEGWL